jgi:hypothetical protein
MRKPIRLQCEKSRLEITRHRRACSRSRHAHARGAWGLPLALLALIMQVMSPVWAAQAIAAQISSPWADAPICSYEAGTNRGSHLPVHCHAGCVACLFCCAGHFALPAGSAVLPLPSTLVLGRQTLRLSGSPRDAPSFRANARAPPSLA